MNRLESTIAQNKEMTKWFDIATALIAFTIVYNLLEGLVSIYFGLEDESFTLFGF
jgi:hypothetical protein